jgi:CHRD domain
MKTLKSLIVLLVFSSLLAGCEKWKDFVHKEKDKEKKIYSAQNLPMSGSQENPPKQTDASGSFDVWYNTETNELKFTLKWEKLTGIPTGAHIHGPAPRGTNAGIKYDFFNIFPKTIAGTFSNSTIVDGVAIKEDSLIMGYYYFNIHTPTNPGGEIRGQIEFK